MTKILVALIAATVTSAAAASDTSENTAVMAVVHQWVDSFNKGDLKTAVTNCADTAAIIDDIPPHVWQGPDACSNWVKAYEAFVSKSALTDQKVTLGKVRHLDVASGHAYLVVPASYGYKSKDGKPVQEAATVTMTLQKGDTGWRITGWSWADQ